MFIFIYLYIPLTSFKREMILKTQIGHSDCKICKILKLNEWVQAHCSIPFHFFASPGLCGSAVSSSSCRPVEQCCSVYWTQDEAITSFQLGAGIWAQQEWNLLSWKASFIYVFIICIYIYICHSHCQHRWSPFYNFERMCSRVLALGADVLWCSVRGLLPDACWYLKISQPKDKISRRASNFS